MALVINRKDEERNERIPVRSGAEGLTAADAGGRGDAGGDVTLVELFDYQCGYCKRARR